MSAFINLYKGSPCAGNGKQGLKEDKGIFRKKQEMLKPLISVVIPTYNRASLLVRCLESLTRQTTQDFEVIVSDDGSTDSTREVVDSFRSRLSLSYISEGNFGGPARPRNRAIKIACADYIAFLDCDDWWEPIKLEACLKILRSGADFVYHDMWIMTSENEAKKYKIRSGNPKVPIFENILCSGISIPNSSVVVRKNLLLQVSGFSEDPMLIAVEDMDCWLNIATVSNRFVRIPRPLGCYWSAPNSISSPSSLQILRLKTLYGRHLDRLSSKEKNKAEAFFHYRSARIHHACNNTIEALAEYDLAMNGALSLKFIAKSLIFKTTLQTK